MKIAHIIPFPWVGLYPKGNYRMVLAHWILQNPQYTKALRSPTTPLAGSDAYVFMDNGSFEGENLTPEQLTDAVQQIGADEVVLPDVIGNPRKTLTASWASLARIATKRVMFVPQGGSTEEWSQCLKAWLHRWENSEWKNERALTIGITSLRPKDSKKPIVGSRPSLIVEAAETPYPFHLLGVASPKAFGIEELPVACACGARGVDTSTAFALAAAGKVLTLSQPKVRLKNPEDYETLNTGARRLVWLNMAILESWVDEGKGSDDLATWLIRDTARHWLKYFAEGFCPLEDALRACGMKGRFALTKDGRKPRREKSVRILSEGERPLEFEEELEVQ